MAENAPRITLVSPLHDPNSKLLSYIKKYGRALKKIYHGNVCVAVTTETNSKVISELKRLGFNISSEHKNAADNYRHAIKMGIKTNASYIHQVDFDRALHWVNRFSNELKDVIYYIPSYSGFLSFIRTRRAFESHPLIQRTTETTVNAIASEVAGVDVDIMSGSFGFDRELTELIAKESKRTDFGIYAEFLTIALRHKMKINTMEVEGLEWETPDQFKDKIEQEGYSAWLNEFESLPEWQRRVKLIEDSTNVLT